MDGLLGLQRISAGFGMPRTFPYALTNLESCYATFLIKGDVGSFFWRAQVSGQYHSHLNSV